MLSKEQSSMQSTENSTLYSNYKRMSDLLIKLETLKDSKEWEKICTELEGTVKEQNDRLLNSCSIDLQDVFYTEWDLIRHEIEYIEWLKDRLAKLKDKEVREALIEDLNKSIKWREDRILGRTHEYFLDSYKDNEADYNEADYFRAENWWIECFKNLPAKLVEELKVKETQVKEMQDAEVQEQIDALASLESKGL